MGLLCLISSTGTDANPSGQIQVVTSYNKRVVLHSYANGKVDDAVTSYVKLRIQNKINDGPFGSATELLLSNDAKSEVEKPFICENADRTILGFTTCAALLDYTINLVYITTDGEAIVNQNFNQKLTELLKTNNPSIEVDPTGLYLEHIDGRRFFTAFRSDSGRGSFKFQVQLTSDDRFEIVPKSITFDN